MWWKLPYICGVLCGRIHYKYHYKYHHKYQAKKSPQIRQIYDWKSPHLHHIFTTTPPQLHHNFIVEITTTLCKFHHSLITTTCGVFCGVFALVKFTTYAFLSAMQATVSILLSKSSLQCSELYSKHSSFMEGRRVVQWNHSQACSPRSLW